MMQLATLCYVRRGDSTLMLHRSNRPDDVHSGKWNGLGGKFNTGESPEECVIREVYEESGLRIANPTLKGVLTFPKFIKDVDWYVFVFVATEFSGRLEDSAEGCLHWIDHHCIPDLNLWEGDKIFLKWLEEETFFSGKFEYKNGILTNHYGKFH